MSISQRIKERVDIVDFISSYVKLTRSGKNYIGLCPFHNDHNPSFTVSPEKQLFYCFGCKEGGDVVKFLMKIEHLSYREALAQLGRRVGIELDDTSDEGVGGIRELYKINDLVMKYFNYILVETQYGKGPREYLAKRGIKKETIDTFKLGYAIASWNALQKFLEKKGISIEVQEMLGLIINDKETGKCYDRFRDRIIFPIIDMTGHTVGFGGRVLDDSLPKYINTPETPIFKKGHILYGLYQTRDEIMKKDQVIIVEGYMDCISLYQAGIKNVVASMGTSFTREQGLALKRIAKDIVIAFDTDTAGDLAVVRGANILREVGCNVRIARWTVFKDPDEFIRNQGPIVFLDIINRAKPFLDYMLDLLINRYEITSLEGRIQFFQEFFPLLRSEPRVSVQRAYLDKIATLGKIPPELLYREFDLFYTSRKKEFEVTSISALSWMRREDIDTLREKLERQLLFFALNDVKFLNIIKEIFQSDVFTIKEYREIYERLLQWNFEEGGFEIEDDNLSSIIAKINISEQIELSENNLNETINRLNGIILQKKKEELIRELELAEKSGEVEKAKELATKIQDLTKEIFSIGERRMSING
ncbi:MAG: DNA primase [bacterium]|nr:DNA primase [bacterium]